MKILKTYRNERLNYIETEYRNGYPTLFLKRPEFFNSTNRCTFTPVHIGYTYNQTKEETS